MPLLLTRFGENTEHYMGMLVLLEMQGLCCKAGNRLLCGWETLPLFLLLMGKGMESSIAE